MKICSLYIIIRLEKRFSLFVIIYAPSYSLYVLHFDMLIISNVTTYHYPRRKYTIYENEIPEVKINWN